MTALVYGARAGVGGLGLQAATAAVGLVLAGPVVGLGPGQATVWPLASPCPNLGWEDAPPFRDNWFARNFVRRFRPGQFVLDQNRYLGRWAASRLDALSPERIYAFTQVGFEALEWAKSRGIATVLDNPNGHIREFAKVYREEWAKWVGGRYAGHPTDAMIERVEREYELADRIRVSSTWAKESMIRHGVRADKVTMCPQPMDLSRFRPQLSRSLRSGPLRVVFVGSLDLRKGFIYLLRAARAAGPNLVKIELVGGTGDRGSKRLLAAERDGLHVEVRPGDPVTAYHRAELFVLPSLEEGFGFVVAEAMASGLPVVVTDQCGAAEWVRSGETGWIVPSRDENAIARVLEEALARRGELFEMGLAARRAVESLEPNLVLRQLANWFNSTVFNT